jgi:hypothetical protein
MSKTLIIARIIPFLVSCFLISYCNAAPARLSPNAKFSVLTCAPGPDLYSLFGHSAFRLRDTLSGQPIDVVFNYGVFDAFDDGFYMKFARGKLDYRLQAEYFGYFLESYAAEGRGVVEQELLFSPEQNQRLFELLQQNVLESNCVYRYDFFYDNCSSRIRDMIIRASSGQPTDALGFRYVSLETLLALNKVDFNRPCGEEISYRRAIQTYLDYQPWSDLGIDIALGQPCDRLMGEYGAMFLPDSLMKELQYASLEGRLLCKEPKELLPSTTTMSVSLLSGPLSIFCLWLLVHLFISYRMRHTKRSLLVAEGFLLSVCSLISMLVIFLWFMTDHTTTQNNWNILWASPLHLVVLFLRNKKSVIRVFSAAQLVVCIATLAAFPIIPQVMHVAVLPILGMLIITYVRLYRNARIIEH